MQAHGTDKSVYLQFSRPSVLPYQRPASRERREADIEDAVHHDHRIIAHRSVTLGYGIAVPAAEDVPALSLRRGLQQAADAIVLDNSYMTIPEQMEWFDKEFARVQAELA